jgi:hypothetical protein
LGSSNKRLQLLCCSFAALVLLSAGQGGEGWRNNPAVAASTGAWSLMPKWCYEAVEARSTHILAVDARLAPTTLKRRLLRRAHQQGTSAGVLCLAPVYPGRLATLVKLYLLLGGPSPAPCR